MVQACNHSTWKAKTEAVVLRLALTTCESLAQKKNKQDTAKTTCQSRQVVNVFNSERHSSNELHFFVICFPMYKQKCFIIHC